MNNNIVYTKVSDYDNMSDNTKISDNDTLKLIDQVNDSINDLDYSLLENFQTNELDELSEINELTQEKINEINEINETNGINEINEINNKKEIIKKTNLSNENCIIFKFYGIKFTKNMIMFVVLMTLAICICYVSIIKIE